MAGADVPSPPPPRWRILLRRGEPFAPYAVAAFKILVSVFFLHLYVTRFLRIMYIADDAARGIEAYRLAFAGFTFFPTHQFPPLPLWLWAAFLKLWPNIYYTGTVINVAAGAGTAAFLYLLGKRLGGAWAGVVAALIFTFSPVHHNLTLSMGMAEPVFYFWLAAGIFFAARAEAGRAGASAAGFCFAAAALSRYEGTLFLALYALYRLLRRRPRSPVAWALWLAPLAIAGVFLGEKAFIGTHQGLWPALAGVHADTAAVLPNPTWYRRLGYGFYRLLFDGRAAAVLAFAGAALVWRRPWRTPDRLVIWTAAAVYFGALVGIAGVVGVGFCPERYFATPLMLFFPFAGFAAAWLARAGRTALRSFGAVGVLIAAAAVTAGWDMQITTPGYGFKGPTFARPVFAAETALVLRDLWRSGELKPDEPVLIEKGERLFEEYPIRAFSDRPLNFSRVERDALRAEIPDLLIFMAAENARIAIVLSRDDRAALKNYYGTICGTAVIYENPTQTIVVLREGWRRVPDFTTRYTPRHPTVVYTMKRAGKEGAGTAFGPDK